MAKQRETRKTPARTTAPARRTATPAVPEKLKWIDVEFTTPQQSASTPESEVPAGWDDAEEAPSSLTPAADWQTPGEGFIGEYIGMQMEVGPNKSKLYAFRAGDGSAVSIWGSTALDARMDFLQPAKGDTLLVQYLGDQPTSRGLNPVKTFKVMRKK
jgi:hypothetical protein